MIRTLLTAEAKETLRKTIRGLRAELIAELGEAAEGEYTRHPRVAMDRHFRAA